MLVFLGLISNNESICLTVAEALFLVVLPIFFLIVKVVFLHDYTAYFIPGLRSIGYIDASSRFSIIQPVLISLTY